VPLDLIQFSDDLGSYRQWFCLSPPQWLACSHGLQLSWSSVKFEPAQQSAIPQSRGVYAFVVKPKVKGFFELGYLMYIGQTGARSDRTLRDRFGEYLRQSHVKKRVRIDKMMQKWGNHLYFYYVALPSGDHDLKDIELKFNDALIPPCVAGDFSPAIATAVRAW
jgi:hypothetical protein